LGAALPEASSSALVSKDVVRSWCELPDHRSGKGKTVGVAAFARLRADIVRRRCGLCAGGCRRRHAGGCDRTNEEHELPGIRGVMSGCPPPHPGQRHAVFDDVMERSITETLGAGRSQIWCSWIEILSERRQTAPIDAVAGRTRRPELIPPCPHVLSVHRQRIRQRAYTRPGRGGRRFTGLGRF